MNSSIEDNNLSKSFLNDIEEKRPIILETHNTDNDFTDQVDLALSHILKIKANQHLKPPIYFILRELIANANKANLKRVYFKKNDLHINIPEDYAKGMSNFSKILLDSPASLEDLLYDYKMLVKVVFQEYAGRTFTLLVMNNSTPTDEENTRIADKLKFYRSSASDDSTVSEILDHTEGAGLGLFLSFKMLEKVGIKNETLTYKVEKNFTIFKISFNYNDTTPAPYHIIAEQILSEIKNLPKFPENIKALLVKLLKPDIRIQDIADDISKDPSLSADLLQLVNSAKFMLNRKISAIKDAINLVGIKGVKNLLYSYGAMQSINNRFGTVKEIWDHCFETAKVAAKIAKIKNLDKTDDEFFTAGLLHDMGKIVLMSFDKEKAKRVEELCQKRGVDIPLMEEIMMGLSHAKIGGEIARLWDFPGSLVAAISFHHDPVMTDKYQELVYAIYLANHLVRFRTDESFNLFSVEFDVRNFFGLETKDKLIQFYNTLNEP